MTTVQVDVDLDEFDTDELVSELCHRIENESKNSRKILRQKDRDKLIEKFDELLKLLKINKQDNLIEIKSLDDQLKYEHIAKVFNKYTTSYIENSLPE